MPAASALRAEKVIAERSGSSTGGVEANRRDYDQLIKKCGRSRAPKI
jgi:hypothetical protein